MSLHSTVYRICMYMHNGDLFMQLEARFHFRPKKYTPCSFWREKWLFGLGTHVLALIVQHIFIGKTDSICFENIFYAMSICYLIRYTFPSYFVISQCLYRFCKAACSPKEQTMNKQGIARKIGTWVPTKTKCGIVAFL